MINARYESVVASNGAIVEEMIEWFKGEAVPAPWVKQINEVAVQVFRLFRR